MMRRCIFIFELNAEFVSIRKPFKNISVTEVSWLSICCYYSQLLRTQLHSLQAYLFSCKQPVAEELLSKVSGKSYLLDSIHVYSLRVCGSKYFIGINNLLVT